MITFQIAFLNVLLSLLYMFPGFLLCKCKKAAADHLPSICTILIYVCSPCMIVSSFLSMEYKKEDLMRMVLFFLISLVMQLLFMGGVFIICRKKFHLSRYRMLTIGSVLGNVGFFGLPLVKALMPDCPEVACYSSIYVVSMNLIVFTAGVFCLTTEKKYMSLKAAFNNPAFYSFVVAVPLYLVNASSFLPSFLVEGVSLLGKMTTPLCMLILGIRLATMDIKKLFTNSFVYLICAGKLLLFPLFCYALVSFLPLPVSFKGSILMLAATPCASIILNLAEIHKKEPEMSANCILLSTLLSIFTIPLMALFLSF